MMDLVRQYSSLSPEKRALFKQLLRAKGIDADTLILPEERANPVFPLSFAQQRMWFLYQLDPASPYYNIPSTYRLEGRLDLDCFRMALAEIIRRHEALRTVFHVVDGQPRQVILPELALPLAVHDLTGLPSAERETRAMQMVDEEALRPFDLCAGPLLRVVVWKLGEEAHLAAITFHHIVADGWSMNVFIRELIALYAGQAARLPELHIQYADYAAWQRRAFQGALVQQHLDYWKDKLAGAQPLLELPTDHPRPAAQSFRGGYVPFHIPAGLAAQLQVLARQEGVSLFMLLLAAFQVLLMRYSAQEDIITGTPIANRGRAELEPLIGFFVNTLVLRSDLSGDPTFSELLARVKETCLGAYAHQDLPFEQIVEAIQPERTTSYNPLFQVMFVLQNAERGPVRIPGLSVSPLDVHSGTTKFDLTLTVREEALPGLGGLAGGFEFALDLWDEPTITRMAGHFATLLESICAGTGQPLSQLNLLPAAERQQILEWGNALPTHHSPTSVGDAGAAGPGGASMGAPATAVSRFAEQVRRNPSAIALEFQGQQLSYAALDERANRLAHYLRAQGAGPDVIVGLCMERSIELIVALLAIQKAGGAYLPLDPRYPPERLALMLEDSGAPLLLTQSPLQDLLPCTCATRLCVDQLAEELLSQPTTPPELALLPEHLAYVIYTSGSTGRPKGALVPHRGLITFTTAFSAGLETGPHTALLQFASISFDGAAAEIFLALHSGGKLVLASQETLLSIPELARLIETHGVNTAILPPAVLDMLDPRDVPGLSTVVSAADACPPRVAQKWCKRRFFNGYGPTETSIGATLARIRPCPGDQLHSVPIGRPVQNVRVYVLDARRALQPLGVPGELYIAGPGVVRGYLNRPELTAERFLPDPFAGDPAARMYKTGDHVRWLPDGELAFLGRLDHQVKVRGLRIELGEIEADLLQHAAVQQAVVLPLENENGQGNRGLVAYAVAADPANPPAAEEILLFLKARLPSYMVPAQLIWLERIPLLPNGKVNRRALPAPEAIQPTGDQSAQRLPETPVEQGLAEIWKQAIGIPQVSLDDRFFERGGHSLRAAQLAAHIREVFQVEYPLRSILDNPSLAEMAAQVETLLASRTGSLGAPIRPVERTPGEDGAFYAPLSFAQQRLWFIEQLDPGGALYNTPLAVRLKGNLDHAALEAGLNGVLNRHENLRTAFIERDGVAYQKIFPALRVELPLIDLTARLAGLSAAEQEAAAREIILAEARKPFDLSQAPLLRGALIRIAADDHVAVFVIHHIVTDGWSMGVLANELVTLYSQAVSGAAEAPALAALPVQYADYARWQREWLQGETLERLIEYWRATLAGIPPQLELPTDHPRPAVQTQNGSNYAFHIDPALTARLKALCQQEGVTLFMALLAAFQAALFRYTGQTDFAIGTPIANRSRAELEPLIGFFVNTLVLRADLATVPGSCAPGFRDLLARVRETCLGAYAHQDLPFEALVDAIRPERSLSRSPFFQVMMILQNTPAPGRSFPGLESEWLDLDPGTSTFDLTLAFQEDGDGLTAGLEYNTDLFERETVARLAGHFTNLLAAALDAPDQPVERLPMLSEEETCQLLAAWNNTTTPHPDLALPVHRLVERRALECPTARAVFAPAEGEGVSYAQLNARANQLARLLQSQGVTPGSITAFCLERSTAAIVSLLAILKTGAAFLPIDPAYPPERIRFMLSDSAAPLLLTSRKLAAQLPEVETPLLILEDAQALVEEQSDENLYVPVESADLAYVIYTSGSTGQPKGVLVEHRALVNHNLAMIRLFGLSDQDHVLQFASLSFDAAYEEIFPALICGAELIERPAGDLPGGAELMAWVDRYHLTLLDLPTAYWHALTTELVEAKLPRPASLRLVVVGGEKASTEKLALFQAWAGEQVRWLNTYGPTEAAIVATAHCPERVQNPEERLPIGRPIDNVRAYVLDSLRQPVPQGVAGELYLAGACVARGYLNRPELTAERFLPDPFYPGDNGPAARMYRTGDLARWLPDGTLEYAGRVDFQVKIRGFRVEPGEVEAALVRHPAIAQAAVVPFTPPAGPTRLVGYLVTGDAEEAPSLEALRAFLREELPDYMVPAALVFLPALPLNASGKVDRRALPAPTEERPELENEYTAPTAPAEQTLAAIWQQVLNLPQVGVNDNFFALGGDSILSLQVVARARQAGFNVSPRMLFENPTVAGLAAAAEAAASAAPGGLPGAAGPAPEQGPVTGAYPLTPIQRWFFQQPLTNPAHWNQSLLLALPQLPDPGELSRALVALVNHHDALRTRFTRGADGEWAAEILPPVEAWGELPIHDLSHLSGEAQKAELSARCTAIQASFDLAQPPLLAAGLFWLGEGGNHGHSGGARLLLAAHHLVVDGISWRILLEDLASALEQVRRGMQAGGSVLLPPKSHSFRQWALLLPELAQAPAALDELPYWLQAEAAAPLPMDYQPDPVLVEPSASHSVYLDEAETTQLLQQAAPALRATPEGLLLAALAWALRDWAGPELFAVELEHHGRADDLPLDLSRTAGWFTADFPLALDLRAANTPLDCLRAVKDALHALPHDGVGYGWLAAYHPDPAIRARLEQVGKLPISFNYLGQFDDGPSHSSLTVAGEDRGVERDPLAPAQAAININGAVVNGRLGLEITYQPSVYHPSTLERLAGSFSAALRALLSPESAAEPAQVLSVGDFPLADLNQKALKRVLKKINPSRERPTR